MPLFAQPAPRGPEVTVDLIGGSNDCPLIAGRPEGGIALLWNHSHLLSDRLLSRVVNSGNALGAVAILEEEPDAFQLPRYLVATPRGYRAVWIHAGYSIEWTFRSADLAADGFPGTPLELVRLGFAGFELSPRPGGGYVKHWTSDRALFLQILDESGHPAGPAARLELSGAYSSMVLHHADGTSVALVLQEVIRGPLLRVVWMQRFDGAGHLVGPARRVVPAAYLFEPFVASIGVDGMIATSAVLGYGFPRSHAITLQTFTAGGEPLWRRTIRPRTPRDFLRAKAVAIDPTGRVLWIWEQLREGLLVAQVFEATGKPLGPRFRIPSSASASRPRILCVSADWAGDDWVVVWQSSGERPNGASLGSRTYLRRFARD